MKLRHLPVLLVRSRYKKHLTYFRLWVFHMSKLLEAAAGSPAEDVPEVVVERVHPDGFFGQQGLVVRVEFASPLGLAKEDPIRSSVAGTAESGLFDKGFQQYRPVSVVTLPVVWESSRGHPQDARGEVVAANPGEDEEARVVGHQVKALLSLRWGPPDEAVPRLGLPGGGAEAEQGHDASAGQDKIAELGPG